MLDNAPKNIHFKQKKFNIDITFQKLSDELK